ncbi:methyl-accepting chemotaxis protein [Pantoea sp. B65]|uniref:methyl-accepting chemotaxis protein n=1 Tax=Pantoea sp. B65 TaxID=2813359 RepID=UPI0039B66C08
MSWIYHVAMKFKIGIALVPLSVVLIWLSANGITTRLHIEQQMTLLKQQVEVAKAAGDGIHELQKERGMSSGFLSSKGVQFAADLQQQQAKTDAMLARFELMVKQNADDSLHDSIAAFSQTIAPLTAMRGRIGQQQLAPNEAVAWYSQNIVNLMNIVSNISQNATSAEIMKNLDAYYSLLNLKEQAGIERAVLAAVFASDHFTVAQQQKLNTLVGAQQAWQNALFLSADSDFRRSFAQLMQQPESRDALELRQQALQLASSDHLGISAQLWFALQSKRIDVLKTQENRLAGQLLSTADAIHASARQDRILFLAITLLALLGALLIARMIVKSIDSQLSHTLNTIASMGGDLTQRLAVPGSDELSALNQAYNQSIEKIQQMVQQIKTSSGALRIASNDIASGNEDLAQRTDEQASSLVETAASMEQIATAIQQTADNAHQVEQLTSELETQMQQANLIAQQASETMGDIRQSSERIGGIVGAIDDISFQTNLLALNAAVEAARAGEQGKGFAVVANEVRNLSQRCAREAQQIRDLVRLTMEKVVVGVARVEASGKALASASEQTVRMKHYVTDIARAAEEQSLGVAQVNFAISQLEQVTQQNASMVSAATCSSQLLDQQSESMAELVGQFTVA